MGAEDPVTNYDQVSTLLAAVRLARPEEGSQHQRPCEASRHPPCPLGARGAREGDVSSALSAPEFGLSPADTVSRSRRHRLWDGNDFTPGYG